MKESDLKRWSTALTEAVETMEEKSAAEVVVAIRPSSRRYVIGDVLAGLAASVALLLFLLYSPYDFELYWFAVLPPVVFLSVVEIFSSYPLFRRLVQRESQRHAIVRQLAQSTFYELNVSNTRERTGLLLFFSELERHVEIVTDLGWPAERAERSESWARAVEQLRRAWNEERTPDTVQKAMEAFAQPLAELLPGRADDENELSNEVRVG